MGELFCLWEKAMATHSSTLAWKIPGMEGCHPTLVGCCLWGCTESDMTEVTWQQQFLSFSLNRLNNSLSLFTFMHSHSSVLAWRIPGTGEPGGLPSMGSHRVGYD